MTRRVAVTVALALSAAVSVSAATGDAGAEKLGSVEFPNSGAAEAQESFLRGVLLLHSFEYEDAAEAFREAQMADPGFALAYWGEALTYDHPLWRQQDRDAALAALGRLAPTAEERLAKAPTERERGYLEAVETLYGLEGDEASRDEAYERAMGRLAERHPDDLEARAFHALSILGTAQAVRDFRIYMSAAAVAEEVFAANPEHPGAAHYLIHSYDDPIHAALGLRAARVYAEIAPAASHAQHMISHIFVALGRWEESVDANVAAYRVSVERAERKGLGVDAHNFHALHWLQYSYLQLGRIDDARRLAESMREMAAESGSERALGYYSAMRAGLVVESEIADVAPLDVEGSGLVSEVTDHFADGMLALRNGELEAARHALVELALRRQLGAEAPADARSAAEVMEGELEALVLWEEGQREAAITRLEEAAELEVAQALDYGPPTIVKPSHELLGELLLESDRPAEAAAQLAVALERAPRRRAALTGVASAASRLGEIEGAAAACAELGAILSGADEGVAAPAVCDGVRSAR